MDCLKELMNIVATIAAYLLAALETLLTLDEAIIRKFHVHLSEPRSDIEMIEKDGSNLSKTWPWVIPIPCAKIHLIRDWMR